MWWSGTERTIDQEKRNVTDEIDNQLLEGKKCSDIDVFLSDIRSARVPFPIS